MKLLVKLGGTLLDVEATREALARQIAAHSRSVAVVVVHGGGRQMTRFLAERGIESQFVNGLRVTTPQVLEAVLKVLAGSVNQELVAAFTAAPLASDASAKSAMPIMNMRRYPTASPNRPPVIRNSENPSP